MDNQVDYRTISRLSTEVEELKKENQRLREALEFYANATNNPKQYMRQGYLVYNLKKAMFIDGGEKARTLLKELGGT